MSTKLKVYKLFDCPTPKVSPIGGPIYEWEYLDDAGVIQKDKKNIQEQIQSYLSRVDYKTQIEKGEFNPDGTITNTSVDYTTIPDNTIDIYNMLVNLADVSPEQVANILEQARSRDQESIQTEQETNRETAGGGQTITKDVQSESPDGKINSDSTQGGK